jgi:hypothetical protein
MIKRYVTKWLFKSKYVYDKKLIVYNKKKVFFHQKWGYLSIKFRTAIKPENLSNNI